MASNKTLILHIGALTALVNGLLIVMVKRDPEAVREVVDELKDIASLGGGMLSGYSRKDVAALQDIMDQIIRPHRMALGELPGGEGTHIHETHTRAS